MDGDSDDELDPRIQIELEKLNSATDDINKLEIELDEANTTFRMLRNESVRRLKVLSKKLGGCIERARPYYDAVEVARGAQQECQRAAVIFQRANEIHAAAKETVALAEQRFMSNKDEWQFDNAWQEMLNHATIKVMEAENQKTESGREHQKRAALFNNAEQNVLQLEERLRRHIVKSRPYFEEKALCHDQLTTQKQRILDLERQIEKTKFSYAEALRQLERISNEIHMKRQGNAAGGGAVGESDDSELLKGPREPGVGAELGNCEPSKSSARTDDFNLECDVRSVLSTSGTASSAVSERDEDEDIDEVTTTVDELKAKVKELAIRPIEGGEGKSSTDEYWESELKNTVDKLDRMMLIRESVQRASEYEANLKSATTTASSSSKKEVEVKGVERY